MGRTVMEQCNVANNGGMEVGGEKTSMGNRRCYSTRGQAMNTQSNV